MSLADKIWWTRKSRIQAEKRLLANAFQSQLLLLWYSFSAVAVSVFYLKFSTLAAAADLASISWVVYSVLVLCMSGFVSGLSFKERAGLIKESYEVLGTLHQKAMLKDAKIDELANEYGNLMGLCENHTDYDYYIAMCIEWVTCTGEIDSSTKLKKGLDKRPTWYHWVSLFWWILRRYLMLTVLYILPILLFVGLEAQK